MPVVEQVVTVTVIELPDAADGVNVQPVAVPAFVKSPAAIPDTLSEKVSVYAIEVLFVGEVTTELKEVTVGGVASSVKVTAVPLKRLPYLSRERAWIV